MSEKKEKVTETAAAGGDGSINKVLELVENMTVLQLADLVKTLEERWGVTAAAPMMAAVAGSAAGAGDDKGAAKEEQTEFTVVLKGSGDKKIQVIKVVRELTSLGLKEAKDLVDNLGNVKEKATKEEAQKMKAKLEEVGAVVEVK